MTQSIAGSARIHADPTAVWATLSDFHNVDRWATLITNVEDTGPTPRGVGAARRCEVRGLGIIDEVVVEWDEGRSLAYRVGAAGPIKQSTSRWQIHDEGDGTSRVELRLDYEMRFGPLGALAARAGLDRLLTGALRRVIAAFKRHVESPSRHTFDMRAHFDRLMARRDADVSFDRFEADRVRSDGIELHLDVIPISRGTPTVVFVPGTAVYGLIFADFLAALADRGYNIVSFDPRGHGRSGGRRGSYTIAEIVRDARAVIGYARERFGGPVFVAGSSQGGIAAFYTAATGEELAGAICHNAADLADPRNAELTAHPVAARLLARAVRAAAAVAPNAGFDMQWYFRLLSRGHDDVKGLLAADPLALKIVRLRSLASLAWTEMARPVEQIATPVFILHGERDSIFPLPYMRRIYDRLTCDKSMKVYPGVDHFLITGHATRVATDVADWIARRCSP